MTPDQALDYATSVGWTAGMAALLLVVAVVAHREHRRATPLARRARAPVHLTRWVALVVSAAYFALGTTPSLSLTAWPSLVYALVNLALLFVPIGVVLALVRERAADARAGALAPRLARAPVEPAQLERELRAALGDPSARLLFMDPANGQWIGSAGEPVEGPRVPAASTWPPAPEPDPRVPAASTWPPAPEPARVALIHDPAVDPRRAASALAVADLGLEGARLRALIAAAEAAPDAQQAGEGAAAMLTPREREVMALVVAGLTDRAIAGRLVLTRRTVETHIGHAFAKLDVPAGPDENRRVHAVRRLL